MCQIVLGTENLVHAKESNKYFLIIALEIPISYFSMDVPLSFGYIRTLMLVSFSSPYNVFALLKF